MKAIFDKPEPTNDGLTLTLKVKCKKEEKKPLLREAAELYGEECNIELDVRKSDNEPKADDMPEYMQEIYRIIEVAKTKAVFDYIDKEDAERGIFEEAANELSKEIIHESPERQKDVVEAHDQIENNKSPYAPATDGF